MSLLMQALKKAEHAKKQSAPTDGTPTPPATEFADLNVTAPDQRLTDMPSGLSLEPNTIQEEPPHIEPQLDSQQIEAPMPMQSPPSQNSEPLPDPIVTPQAPEQSIQAKNSEVIKQSQFKAQTILSANKPARSNSFALIAVSALVLLLIAGGSFYYWQASQYPDTPLIATAKVQGQQAPVKPITEQTPAPAPATSSPEIANNNAPDTASNLQRVAPNDAAQMEAITTQQSKRIPDDRQTEQAALVSSADQIKISKSTAPSTINATLMQAYQQFTSGYVNEARASYETVLHQEPNNRDALLGIAAIALKQKQPDQAAANYSKLLDLNPVDPDAIAGLVSLRHSDPDQSESQLKKTLAQNPQSGATLFELGNLYAQQSRWGEAQEIYFRAFGTSPANADYAYNLAISLDRLGQSKLALDYYQRALALSTKTPGNFGQDAAMSRIAQLQQVGN